MADTSDSSRKTIIAVLLVVVVAIAAYAVLTMPDRRTTGQRVGDAIDQVEQGDLRQAGRELQDRTPGERLGDAVQDAGREIENRTDR